MDSFRAFDIFAGGIALLAGLCGSFLIATGGDAGLPEFAGMALCLLFLAGFVLGSRVYEYHVSAYHRGSGKPSGDPPTGNPGEKQTVVHELSVVDQLVRLLPAELAFELRLKQGNSISVESVITHLSTHIEDQRLLLNNNMQKLLYPGFSASETLRESENTLSLLLSELATLEDQYATDLQNNKNANGDESRN